MGKTFFCTLMCIALLLVTCSGCLGSSSDEDVNETISSFLTSFNNGDLNTAFSYYEGKDFLVPATLEIKFNNRGILIDSIKQFELKDTVVDGDVGYTTAVCEVTHFEKNKAAGTEQKLIYFRVQKVGALWVITKVDLDGPISASETLEDIEVPATPVDPIINNIPLISGVTVAVLALGIILNKKDKSGGDSTPVLDISTAVPVEKEALAQFIKFVPAHQYSAGSKAAVDIWIKNFSQQSYDNLTVIANFPGTVKVKKPALSFGSIGPGETVKKTWSITPAISGWVAIEEPMVVFEYAGTRYSGQLDPVWLNVQ
ncbi:hypothetical protein J7W08_01640 [Methanococcoides orientis]|uniref:hypothetical protein n=1 Tax=Methanococcoides orientis TaxID=2822137 RepID=UPI001E5A04A3|nr:hypothetical protein [Methanococcoides orientis]UGV41042.1 hypothetical protein J7W08_01640 [Methanococcoides orientis]